MKTLILERYCYSPNESMGRLSIRGSGSMGEIFTVEKPWKMNLPNESCIPEGFYRCHRVNSPRFGNTFEVDVPGRTHILFHAANKASELKGCIAPGLQQTPDAVLQSRPALAIFHEALQNVDSFYLSIVSKSATITGY